MMIVFDILFIFWVVRIVGNVVSFTHLWWVKEYRWDRMLIHLNTPQGKRLYFLPWKKPRISPKSIGIISMSLGVLGLFILYSGMPLLMSLFIADVISFPLTFVLVGCTNIPVKLFHMFLIRKAENMLRSCTHLTVLGITGSYGKTSTKEYIATLLSTKYKTLKTQASKNSPIGISEVVVSNLCHEHEVFVVEMGAYKKGEIAYMTRLVRPEIAIITSINAQHQDLFGSIENTMKAKYELVEGLIGKRIAICNADDVRVQEMGTWAKHDGIHVWWYGTRKIFPKGDKIFRASHIKADSSHVQFNCNGMPVYASVVGRHQVSNILAAIAGCVACGMSVEDAGEAVKNIKSIRAVLEKKQGIHGLTLIDDTFNNNPDAARAAIDVLSFEKGKRILVFQPMIELGTYAKELHEEVGAYAASVCDAVILTNPNWSQDFISGVRRVSQKIPVHILNGSKAVAFIKLFAPQGGTVLGKGKEAARILAMLS